MICRNRTDTDEYYGESMKKINSINYGGKVIGVGLIIMFVIPGMLMLINTILKHEAIWLISRVSFIIGAFILICFTMHLFIELYQDKKIEKYYSKHRKVKIKLNDGKYECGACGSRNISSNDTFCNTCGCRYELTEDKKPQEILNDSEKESHATMNEK